MNKFFEVIPDHFIEVSNAIWFKNIKHHVLDTEEYQEGNDIITVYTDRNTKEIYSVNYYTNGLGYYFMSPKELQV